MACRILAVTDRSSEQLHQRHLFTGICVFVGENTAIRSKRITHKLDAYRTIGRPRGLPHRYLYFLEGLKYRNVVIAAQEHRPDLFGEPWVKQADGKQIAVAIRSYRLRRIKFPSFARKTEPAIRLVHVNHQQSFVLKPLPSFSEGSAHCFSLVVRVRWRVEIGRAHV